MNITRASKKTKIAKKLLAEKSCRSCSLILNKTPCVDTKGLRKPHRFICASYKESQAVADPIRLPLRKLEMYYRSIAKRLTRIVLISAGIFLAASGTLSALCLYEVFPGASRTYLLCFAYIPLYVMALFLRERISKKAANVSLQQLEKVL